MRVDASTDCERDSTFGSATAAPPGRLQWNHIAIVKCVLTVNPRYNVVIWVRESGCKGHYKGDTTIHCFGLCLGFGRTVASLILCTVFIKPFTNTRTSQHNDSYYSINSLPQRQFSHDSEKTGATTRLHFN